MATHTPLSVALHEAMDVRGMQPSDLAEATGMRPATLYHITSGRVAIPQREQRDALDAYLAPECPGTTLRICQGKLGAYPSLPITQLCKLAQRAGDDVVERLVALLRAITAP